MPDRKVMAGGRGGVARADLYSSDSQLPPAHIIHHSHFQGCSHHLPLECNELIPKLPPGQPPGHQRSEDLGLRSHGGLCRLARSVERQDGVMQRVRSVGHRNTQQAWGVVQAVRSRRSLPVHTSNVKQDEETPKAVEKCILAIKGWLSELSG